MWVGFVLAFSARWAVAYFGLSCFQQVVFHTKVPLEGSDKSFLWSWLKTCVLKGLICALIIALAMVFWAGNILILLISIGVAVVCIIYGLNKVWIIRYIRNFLKKTDVYEKHYVDGRDVKITFPEKKRNLILLYVESMETTYTSRENGGNYKEDLIPEISGLAKENLNFSHQEQLGGANTIEGTGWTTGGLVSQTSGVPLCVSLITDSFKEGAVFLPGAYALGDVLKKEGYEQEFLCGSDAAFGARKFYYDQHGNYKIFDLDEARAQGRIPQDYKEFWGFEDEKLFAIAKDELTRLSQTGKPFHLTMLTVDTHHPHGYVDQNYQNEYPEQLSNIIRGESRKVGEFIQWIKEQPFYEDTTILIAGDHLSMAEEYIHSTYDKRYHRTVLNAFLNAQAEPVQSKNRIFTSMDMYPTILAAMGAKIEGDKLGFGTNLFSEKKTLSEEIGLKQFSTELCKMSYYYKYKILKNEEPVIPEKYKYLQE